MEQEAIIRKALEVVLRRGLASPAKIAPKCLTTAQITANILGVVD